MKILSIETSCDDTGAAVLEIRNSKFKILSNVVSSQKIHKNYGGVFPMMAKREHQKNLLPVLKKALKESKLLTSNSKFIISKEISNPKIKNLEKILEREAELYEHLIEFLKEYKKPDVDAIAVTYGPGLEPCLWVGVNFARALSYFWNIPIIPVNHIEAHILVNFIDLNSKFKIQNSKLFNSLFPAISLVVSGGHTQLILVKRIGKYKIIGETRDDAAGECFDKCAKILGLGYPGGPEIERIAEQAEKNHPDILQNVRIVLPRPMINSKDYDFSFSGLKTAVLYKVRDINPEIVKSKEFINQMCFAVQDAICDVLIKKTLQSAKDFKAKTIILGGGVSANSELRSQFEFKIKNEKLKINLLYPEKSLSTDNALMIAVAGYFHKNKKVRSDLTNLKKIKANANLRIGK